MTTVGLVYDSNLKGISGFENLGDEYGVSVTSRTQILNLTKIPTLLDQVLLFKLECSALTCWLLIRQAFENGALAFFALLGSDSMTQLAKALPSSKVLFVQVATACELSYILQVYGGFLWFAPQTTFSAVSEQVGAIDMTLAGWFTLNASLDTSQEMYKTFQTFYQHQTQSDYKECLASSKSDDCSIPIPTYYSAAVFNGKFANINRRVY